MNSTPSLDQGQSDQLPEPPKTAPEGDAEVMDRDDVPTTGGLARLDEAAEDLSFARGHLARLQEEVLGEGDALADAGPEEKEPGEEVAQKTVTPASLDSFLDDGEVNMDRVKANAGTIDVNVLYQIEDLHHGALLETFSTQAGDTYTFDFQGNALAESTFGLNVFFRYQPEVRGVTVTASAERDNKVEHGVRQGLSGNFIDKDAPDGHQYVEVLGGYTVQVTKQFAENAPELTTLKEQTAQAMRAFNNVTQHKNEPPFDSFMNMVEGERYADIPTEHLSEGKTHGERILHRVVEMSANAGVDPYLTMSLLKAENGEDGNYFGVLKDGVVGFEAQLDWAIKLIQEFQSAYERASGKKAVKKNGRYRVTFLAYFSERYSPSSANPNHFGNLARNYFAYRGESLPNESRLKKLQEKGKQLAMRTYLVSNGEKVLAAGTVSPDAIWEALKDGPPDFHRIVPGWDGVIDPGDYFAERMHPILKRRRLHKGMDFGAPRGTPCRPWKEGTVVSAGPAGGYGNLIIIDHGNGVTSRYAHLKPGSFSDLHPGDHVGPDTQIAQIGSTGMSTGPHLHFEIRINNIPINPLATEADLFPDRAAAEEEEEDLDD